MNKDVAILISSFDGYKDLWMPLEQTYKQFWPDCPYKCYVTTNFEKPHFDFFHYIAVGEDRSWSDMLSRSIYMIEEEYILLTFDDLFLHLEVDTEKIKEYIDYTINNDLNYFGLYPSISKNTLISKNIVSKNKNSKYRNATVWSLWKRDVLLDLLDDNENAWEFEDKGSIRSNKYDKFYCVKSPAIKYVNGVVKGKWVPGTIKILEEKGIELNITDRRVMTKSEFFVFKLKDTLYDLYKYLLFMNRRS